MARTLPRRHFLIPMIVASVVATSFLFAGAAAADPAWFGICTSGNWGAEFIYANTLADLTSKAQEHFDRNGLRLVTARPYVEDGRQKWFGVCRSGDWTNRLIRGDSLADLTSKAQKLFDEQGLRLVSAVPYTEGTSQKWFGICRSGDWTNRLILGDSLADLIYKAQKPFDENGLRLVTVVPYVENGRQKWFGICRSGNWASRLIFGNSLADLTGKAQKLFDENGLRLLTAVPYVENGWQKWVGICRSGDWTNRLLFGDSLTNLTKQARKLFDQDGLRLTEVVSSTQLVGRVSTVTDLDGWRRGHGIPGLAVAVVRDGKTILCKGFGYADTTGKVPATAETHFQLASVTKPFTAIAVMLLVDDKKLSLDDPIRKHIRNVPRAWDEITVRHLLAHLSGIPNYFGANSFDQFTDRESILAWARRTALEFPAGKQHKYSNTGFVLLGEMIESVSGGKPYGDFLHSRLFAPLGMVGTGLRRLEDKQLAVGYMKEGDSVHPAKFLDPKIWDNADGGLTASAADLAVFASALHARRLLDRSSWESLWTRQRLTGGRVIDQGLAFAVNENPGEKLIGHTGGRPGVHTNFSTWFRGSTQVSVIVLCNVGLEGQPAFELGEALADHYGK